MATKKSEHVEVNEAEHDTGFKFTKKKTLSANRYEVPEGRELFIKVESVISIINRPAILDKDNKEKEPAATMPSFFVTDLETGETGQLILPQVLHETFVKNYEGDEYVGQCFRIVKHKVAGKRYFNFELDEIEVG